MALFVNGVHAPVHVLILLLPFFMAVYSLDNKLTSKNASLSYSDSQDVKMATKGFIRNEELHAGAKTVEFDHYILELGWPPSICREERFFNRCKTPWPKRFILHGLWPSKKNPPYPEFCPDAEEFDLVEIKKLVKDLNKYWPTVKKDKSNDQFWKYQWEKHGTCSNLGLAEYFKAGLKLYNDLSLSDRLEAIGVTPGNAYNPSGIVEKYSEEYNNIKPNVRCGKRTITPLVEVLDNFQFKIKKNLKTFETMPSPYTTCQLDSVEYPE